MTQPKINEDFLLLLIEREGLVETTTISIDNHFENESLFIRELCEGGNDNILIITEYIATTISPKLPPNKTLNYCNVLDAPFQSVRINIADEIKNILNHRGAIYLNQALAKKDNEEFDIIEQFRDLKCSIKESVELWFKAFNIDLAYKKAKKVPGVLLYSHRISGWSNPEYNITSNLKQEIKTNFGYGSACYFYSLLTFKSIQITSLSEWIDYKYANYSEVIRHTKSFGGRISRKDEYGKIRLFKTRIENTHWHDAIEFTKNAANLSLTNEEEFIAQYIISECEKMVAGLECFCNKNEFFFISEDENVIVGKEYSRRRVDMNGYELIDFRTEKIIGALDFIDKVAEYNSIIPTNKYIQRIISINKNFIPSVHAELKNQENELKIAVELYRNFLKEHNKLNERNMFYEKEKRTLKDAFDAKYQSEYLTFRELLIKSLATIGRHKKKIELHTNNKHKLTKYINKYYNFINR